MNGLPSAILEGATTTPRPSSATLTKSLSQLASDHPGLDLDADLEIVPVPQKVAHAFSEIIKTANIEERIRRSNDANVVTGGPDPGHPTIRQWKGARDFFMEWTHIDRDDRRMRELPGDVELLQMIAVVEDVIEVRTAQFFENLHAVEDLLDEANTEGAGELE